MLFSLFLQTSILLSILGRPIHASGYNAHVNITDPQPIAINFGLDVITAAYAHSITNISILAVVRVREALPLEEYAKYTAHLRLEHFRQSLVPRSRESGGGVFNLIMSIGHDYITLISKIWNGFVENSDSKLIIGLRMGLKILLDAAYNFFVPILRTLKSPVQQKMDEQFSLEDTKRGFVKAYKVIKNMVWEHSQINITSAVILSPDFFNNAIDRLMYEAAYEAGIMPSLLLTPQTMISAYDDILLDSATKDKRETEKQNFLIIDHGWFYLDIQTRGRKCRLNYPLDSMGSHRIATKLTDRVISSDEYLREQIERGASYDTLYSAVDRARQLIKQKRDFELWDEQVDEGHHYEEWPLDLQDWWIGEKKGVALQWEDVKAVEDEYINNLAEVLDDAMICLQGTRNGIEHNETTPSEDVDTVIILGNYCDGALVKRAVRQAIGDYVKTIGGNPKQDITLAARGGARLAFWYYEAVEKERQAEQGLQHDEL